MLRGGIMCPKSNVEVKLLPIVFLQIFLVFSGVRGRWNDTYDKYDLAYLRRDYLAKYCPTENLFLNCSSQKPPGLSFPNLPENITSEEFSDKFHGQIQSWCESSWSSQRDCERQREQFVDSCFLTFPSSSVGFDLISALFEAACRQKNNNDNATSSSSPIACLLIDADMLWFDVL
ncbi:hypothetical protein Fcan01_24665 [Folsomia candida]|uniref:Uncharacterized protein n=1 Tax=Folsomia candida TaxID=158441 RepID=A0A226D4X2_FOLCA|nr:hypothetical protein Fcan01_24665 [Folsomia candida]